MTTEWNTESIIRASKILACLHGVVGVWMIGISTIAIKALEQDDFMRQAAYPGLITGPLMLIIVTCFAYLALKGSEMGNDATFKRIRIMMKLLGWISLASIGALVVVPFVFGVVELASSFTKPMQKWIAINHVLVSTLTFILTLFSGILALRFAKYFNSAKFLSSRLPHLSQQHQPLEQPGRCSRVQDLPSPTASTISIVDRNVNNLVIREASLPPSYDNLSMHSSVISKYRASSTFSAYGTPPPSYSSVMQTMTRNNPTSPPKYDNLRVHSSFISNYKATPTHSAGVTPPPTYSSVTQTFTGIMY